MSFQTIGDVECTACGGKHRIGRDSDGVLKSMEVCQGEAAQPRMVKVQAEARQGLAQAREHLEAAEELASTVISKSRWTQVLRCLDQALPEIQTVYGKLRDEIIS